MNLIIYRMEIIDQGSLVENPIRSKKKKISRVIISYKF